MKFITNFLKGVAIGAGAIIPGVSSGVICVILGIYEQLLESILGLFKNFKDNIKLLLPIVIGGIIGVVLFGRVLKYLLNACPNQISFTFIGLIMGSIPTLLKKVEERENFKISYIFYLLFTLGIGFGMVMLERSMVETSREHFNFIYLFLAGMCMSVGVIIPGVSSTVILMLLGVYSSYLTSIANVYLPTLIPIVCGLFIGSLICMKVIKFLLEKYYTQTFYSIMGFSIGSVFVLYPGLTVDINGATSILCFFIGFVITKTIED